MTTALLALCLVMCLPLTIMGVTVPLKALSDFSAAEVDSVLLAACTGQGAASVCDPFGYKKYYIKCTDGSAPERKVCGKGRRYDYNHRKCKDMSNPELNVCPFYNCPALPRLGIAIPQGQFGQAGNATFHLEAAGSFEIFCPINGHCVAGMYIEVEVECPAPMDRVPYTFTYPWVETLLNNATYPNHLANIKGYCGDMVFLSWMAPIHIATTFGQVGTPANKLMNSVNPYPPQPLYTCPMWEFSFASGEPQAIPSEGQTVLIPEGVGPQTTTWTATESGEVYFICQAGQHCRMGMIFKVTVGSCTSEAPIEHTVNWVLTYDLFPSLDLCIGDMVTIAWDSPQMFHGVLVANGDTIKPYMYGEANMGGMN
ncbi:hypothetical protein FOA52_013320 [Chlamydomonas sp. UWO 241]|nr:hypothetical protein FOA52_013320 [Chlamydomonas sp. UWO 241]